jgi:hypothetical protein
MKSLITSRMRAAPVLTWAAFPGPTLAPAGLYFFSDVGINGSFWYNNGTSLKPIGPIVLHRLITPLTTSNGTAEEAIAISGKIPVGVLAVGRQLRAEFLISKSGTVESTSNLLKIGTNADGKTGASTASSVLSLSTTSRQLAFIQINNIITNTQVQNISVGGSATPYNISTSAPVGARTIPDITANDVYISLTGTKTTGGIETVSCLGFDVVLA